MIDGYPLDAHVDGLGGLQRRLRRALAPVEFASGAGLDIRIGDQAGFGRTSMQAPTYSDLGQGLERLTSRYRVGPALEVTERVTTVSGEPILRLEYELANLTGQPLAVKAAEIGDVISPFDGQAAGVHADGPPEFVGGLDRLGRRVGLEESTPWSRYEVDTAQVLRANFQTGGGLDSLVASGFYDHAVGAEWDVPLAANQTPARSR